MIMVGPGMCEVTKQKQREVQGTSTKFKTCILTNPKIPRNKTQEFVHEMCCKKIRVVLEVIG